MSDPQRALLRCAAKEVTRVEMSLAVCKVTSCGIEAASLW